jgi:hypothetical protein
MATFSGMRHSLYATNYVPLFAKGNILLDIKQKYGYLQGSGHYHVNMEERTTQDGLLDLECKSKVLILDKIHACICV